jgi:hypothetical protein
VTFTGGARLEGQYYRISVRPPAGAVSGDASPAPDRVSWLARARPALDALFRELTADVELPLVPFSVEHEEVAGVVAGVDGRDKDDSALVRARTRGKPFLVRFSGVDLLPGGDTLELEIVVYRRIRHERVEAILHRVAGLLTSAHGAPDSPPPVSRRLWRWLRGR